MLDETQTAKRAKKLSENTNTNRPKSTTPHQN